MRAILILTVCGLASVQGILQPGETYQVKSGGQLVDASVPEYATCMPTYQVVPFAPKISDNATVEYYPTCTRVRRCGGCCHNSFYTCQPATTESKHFLVSAITRHRNIRKGVQSTQEVVSLEEHTLCMCACPKKKKCGRNKKFDDRDCSCECTNIEERRKCHEEKEIRYWDPQACRCECKYLGFCDPAIEMRDPETCRCIPNPYYVEWQKQKNETLTGSEM